MKKKNRIEPANNFTNWNILLAKFGTNWKSSTSLRLIALELEMIASVVDVVYATFVPIGYVLEVRITWNQFQLVWLCSRGIRRWPMKVFYRYNKPTMIQYDVYCRPLAGKKIIKYHNCTPGSLQFPRKTRKWLKNDTKKTQKGSKFDQTGKKHWMTLDDTKMTQKMTRKWHTIDLFLIHFNQFQSISENDTKMTEKWHEKRQDYQLDQIFIPLKDKIWPQTGKDTWWQEKDTKMTRKTINYSEYLFPKKRQHSTKDTKMTQIRQENW